MRQIGHSRPGYRRRCICWLTGAVVLCLLMLAACGGGASIGSSSPPSRATPFPTIPLPPKRLVLHQRYPANGIIITVSAYERHVDPHTVPIPNPNGAANHFVHLVCAIANTLPHDQVVDLRISTTLYATPAAPAAGSADLTPDVVNGVYTIPQTVATLDHLEAVPAGRTVARDVYYWIDDPPPAVMQLYVQMWNPGDHDITNVRSTPPLFLIDVGDAAAHP